MSEMMREVEPRLQYILNDARFISESSELSTEGMNDIIYTDENQAIILNGEIIQEDNTSTFVLQDNGTDLNHYITNYDTEGEILIANIDTSNIDQYQESQHVIQYVDEDGNIMNAADIVYVNEDGVPLNAEDISSQYQISELMGISRSTCEEDQIEAEGIINFDSTSAVCSDDEGQEDNSFVTISPADWFQYADGAKVKLNEFQYTEVEDGTITLRNNYDGNVTGKNLITGQIVTLDSYMDKIKDRIKSNRTSSINGKLKHNLNAFLNKKFNLGLTIGGKNIVGKIVHVSSKDNRNEEGSTEICGNMDDGKSEILDDPLDKSKQSPVNNKLMCVQTKLLSKKSDQFQRISKILSNLMKTDKIKNQLLNKSIHIDIIDKYCYNIKNIVENVSFISGYMESKTVTKKNDQVKEEWVFIPDTLKTQSKKSNVDKQSQKKYPNTIAVTVLMTHKRDKDYVRILLDSSYRMDNLQCHHCGQLFQTINNMRVHINSEHIVCEICDTLFQTREALLRHKRSHPKKSKEELRYCKVDRCRRYFSTDASYQQHLLSHKLNPNNMATFSDLKACEVCDNIFIDEAELEDHKKSHVESFGFVKQAQAKYYSCEICKRSFSRMANLQRHVAIHKGGDQLFRCSVCRCSYQYISSLTRHILQNHVQLQRPNFA